MFINKKNLFYIFFIGNLFAMILLSGCGLLTKTGDSGSVTSQSLTKGIFIISAPAAQFGQAQPNGWVSLLFQNDNKDYLVTSNLREIGQTPQSAVIFGDFLYIVQSGSQSLMVLNKDTLAIQTEISLGNNTNPWDVAIVSSTKVYVTNQSAHTVAMIDPTQPSLGVIKTIAMPSGNALAPFISTQSSYARPQGIAYDQNKVYVGLTNLNANWLAGGPGLVVVINVLNDQIEKIITLNHTNPQVIYTSAYYPHRLFISETGNYDNTGVIDVIDTLTDTLIGKIAIGGAPGNIAISSKGKGFVTDSSWGSGVKLLTFSADTYQALTPIIVTSNGWASAVFVNDQDDVFVTDFNQDGLYILNLDGILKSGPIQLSDAPKILVEKK